MRSNPDYAISPTSRSETVNGYSTIAVVERSPAFPSQHDTASVEITPQCFQARVGIIRGVPVSVSRDEIDFLYGVRLLQRLGQGSDLIL